MFACVAIDFDTGVVAVVDVNFIYEGINQCCAERVVVCIAVFEFLEEEFYFIKSKYRPYHLLLGKLYFKVSSLGLALLNLRTQHIDRLAGFDCFDKISRGSFVFIEQLFEPL
ncbi:MAG: hypothetical protein FWB97_08995 [Oscillospiraceae bacterium]|nr:hypothetical protein [Oscillospiraceae bacterium]